MIKLYKTKKGFEYSIDDNDYNSLAFHDFHYNSNTVNKTEKLIEVLWFNLCEY